MHRPHSKILSKLFKSIDPIIRFDASSLSKLGFRKIAFLARIAYSLVQSRLYRQSLDSLKSCQGRQD
jgi:hypothetical protein